MISDQSRGIIAISPVSLAAIVGDLKQIATENCFIGAPRSSTLSQIIPRRSKWICKPNFS